DPPFQALVQRWQQNQGVSLTSVREKGSVKVRRTSFDLPDWQNDEAYRLLVKSDTIHLDCHTTIGLLNGLRTLEQLITPTEPGKVTVRQAEIYDYPALPFRGIHFFSGKDSRDLQIKMLSEIMAPLTINQLVY